MDFIPWLFAVVGIGLIVVGIRSLRATSRFHKRAQRAPGVVTELRRRSDGDGSSWYPVVRFNLPDGRTVEAETEYGGSPAPAQQGQPVTVLYDPADPTQIRLPGLIGSGHAFGVILLVMGIGFTILGTLVGSMFLLFDRLGAS